MSFHSVFASASTGTGPVSTTLEDERRARFQKVDENLRALSAIPLARFADASSFDADALFDFPEAPERSKHYAGALKPIRTLADLGIGPSAAKGARAAAEPPAADGPPASNGAEGASAGANMQFVAQLHQTCISTFGNADGLEFEFSEETGKLDSKKCILTISRPNGQTRSYASEPSFSRKSDAKARAAAIAVKLGAVDFILHGYKDAAKKQIKLVPLESLSAARKKMKIKDEEEEEVERAVEEREDSKEPSPEAEIEEDDSSKEISQYCKEWRAGLVKPRWVFFKENKNQLVHGCILAIELTPHFRKLYSVAPTFDSKAAAKKACSTEAIACGVIDYIKHGNGQTEPAEASIAPAVLEVLHHDPKLEQGGKKTMALQDFFESLPQPFPELVEADFERQSPPGLLNSTMQTAKGARLRLDWYFYGEKKQNGAIIRLSRLQETRTYMVDAVFSKRGDAKSAVALQAISEGACAYMRQMGTDVGNKVSLEMKRFASSTVLPILGSEYGKIRKGVHPQFEYRAENDAFGATLTLWLNDDEHRTWTVPSEYRTKQDAKLAVACAHGREAVNYLRFSGAEPPPGYDPFKAKIEQKAAARARQEAKVAGGGKEDRVKREGEERDHPSRDRDRERQRTPTGPRSDRANRRERPRNSFSGAGGGTQHGSRSRVAAAASVIIDRVTGSSAHTLARTPPRPASSTPSHAQPPTAYSASPYHPSPVSAPAAPEYSAGPGTPTYGTPQAAYQPYSPPYPPLPAYTHPPPHTHVSPPPQTAYYQPYTGPVYPYAYPSPQPPSAQPQQYVFPSADAMYGVGQAVPVSVYPHPAHAHAQTAYYPDPHHHTHYFQQQQQQQQPVLVAYPGAEPSRQSQSREYWKEPQQPDETPPSDGVGVANGHGRGRGEGRSPATPTPTPTPSSSGRYPPSHRLTYGNGHDYDYDYDYENNRESRHGNGHAKEREAHRRSRGRRRESRSRSRSRTPSSVEEGQVDAHSRSRSRSRRRSGVTDRRRARGPDSPSAHGDGDGHGREHTNTDGAAAAPYAFPASASSSSTAPPVSTAAASTLASPPRAVSFGACGSGGGKRARPGASPSSTPFALWGGEARERRERDREESEGHARLHKKHRSESSLPVGVGGGRRGGSGGAVGGGMDSIGVDGDGDGYSDVGSGEAGVTAPERSNPPSNSNVKAKSDSNSNATPIPPINPPSTATATPTPNPNTIQSSSWSSFDLLLQFCAEHALPVPSFGYAPVPASSTSQSPHADSRERQEEWKVWIVHGKERLEAPSRFARVEDGRERVSRLVLQRLRRMGAADVVGGRRG